MCDNHSILTEPLVSELIQKRQQLSRQLQHCQNTLEQKTLETLDVACGKVSDAEKIARWDAITDLKTQQITLSSKIELINELIALGERAVSDVPWVPQCRS